MAVTYSVMRFVVLSILATFVVIACHSIVMPAANTVSLVDLGSLEDTAVTANEGIINIGGTDYSLPQSNAPVSFPTTIIYYPAGGYQFVRWEAIDMSIDDPYSQTTTASQTGHVPALTAIYQIEAAPVGGIVSTVDKFSLLTPYLALAGLIVAVSIVYIIKRRRD